MSRIALIKKKKVYHKQNSYELEEKMISITVGFELLIIKTRCATLPRKNRIEIDIND